MSKHDWNPNLYLKFDTERTQPSIDLVSRIDCIIPHSIIDIGCGPGNSTQVLRQKWPQAHILGVDNSPAMIKKAQQDYPNQNWQLFDAGKEVLPNKYDIVFSNATIQWIPNHTALLAYFANMVLNGGVLAVQIPQFFDMPLGKSIANIAENGPWRMATQGVRELFTIHTPHFYYEQLVKHFRKVEIWTTDYYHTMGSHFAILEMMRSTGLKPYLERIPDDNEKQKFENLFLLKIAEDYPLQKNGKVLFPFKRLFFLATK